MQKLFYIFYFLSIFFLEDNFNGFQGDRFPFNSQKHEGSQGNLIKVKEETFIRYSDEAEPLSIIVAMKSFVDSFSFHMNETTIHKVATLNDLPNKYFFLSPLKSDFDNINCWHFFPKTGSNKNINVVSNESVSIDEKKKILELLNFRKNQKDYSGIGKVKKFIGGLYEKGIKEDEEDAFLFGVEDDFFKLIKENTFQGINKDKRKDKEVFELKLGKDLSSSSLHNLKSAIIDFHLRKKAIAKESIDKKKKKMLDYCRNSHSKISYEELKEKIEIYLPDWKAKKLSREISLMLSGEVKEKIAIFLIGDAGCGKTSISKLMLDYFDGLKDTEEKNILIFKAPNFNSSHVDGRALQLRKCVKECISEGEKKNIGKKNIETFIFLQFEEAAALFQKPKGVNDSNNHLQGFFDVWKELSEGYKDIKNGNTYHIKFVITGNLKKEDIEPAIIERSYLHYFEKPEMKKALFGILNDSEFQDKKGFKLLKSNPEVCEFFINELLLPSLDIVESPRALKEDIFRVLIKDLEDSNEKVLSKEIVKKHFDLIVDDIIKEKKETDLSRKLYAGLFKIGFYPIFNLGPFGGLKLSLQMEDLAKAYNIVPPYFTHGVNILSFYALANQLEVRNTLGFLMLLHRLTSITGFRDYFLSKNKIFSNNPDAEAWKSAAVGGCIGGLINYHLQKSEPNYVNYNSTDLPRDLAIGLFFGLGVDYFFRSIFCKDNRENNETKLFSVDKVSGEIFFKSKLGSTNGSFKVGVLGDTIQTKISIGE